MGGGGYTITTFNFLATFGIGKVLKRTQRSKTLKKKKFKINRNIFIFYIILIIFYYYLNKKIITKQFFILFTFSYKYILTFFTHINQICYNFGLLLFSSPLPNTTLFIYFKLKNKND
jgi:hypothetical protein